MLSLRVGVGSFQSMSKAIAGIKARVASIARPVVDSTRTIRPMTTTEDTQTDASAVFMD